MKSSEVRQKFVRYFEKNGHRHVASSSLIPENDPTLLFANAGMNQFKNLFLGLEQRDYTRAVTSQKCVRAGGKHNDLDNVGFTARHHTFFEMLGNFSFGDYFKTDAIRFAWEFLTKDLGLPKDKLYVTVFREDDEAAEIWHKQEGVPKDRIFRFDEKDNFWRMGDVGPCGPCSEIFFDHGPLAGKIADPYKGIAAGEDRFVEIWNLVFMQYDETAPGQMTPLPKPSVDTGSGLERVVAALQGRYNNYNTDLFTPMIRNAADKMGWDIEEMIAAEMTLRKDPGLSQVLGRPTKLFVEQLAALRVLADHSRSTGFLIADGALPSNEGRGYVLRRILRRAVRFGRKLSEQHSFLPDMVEYLIKQMSPVYPELESRRQLILQTVRDEEQRFLLTLDQGTHILQQELDTLSSRSQRVLPGPVVFKLYDSFGFPADLTQLIAKEKGFDIDEAGFEAEMDKARSRSKASWKGAALGTDEKHLITLSQSARDGAGPTVFTGYDSTDGAGKIVGLSNGQASVERLTAGQNGLVIFDRTPYYAEGGGQVGDQGELTSNAGLRARVHNCTKHHDMHVLHVEVLTGALTAGEAIQQRVDGSSRRQTMANHSATHLMHAALRKVLGEHVTQAGSVVDPDRLRFDFTHPKPLTRDEVRQIEELVNEQIGRSLPVKVELMGPKEAIANGALALFGEKYGDEVRVLTMGDFSCELCGGTHVSNTSQIRLFKIMSEGGVSAGVRRIEAITGDGALQELFEKHDLASRVLSATGGADPQQWIEERKKEISALEKEIRQLKGGQVSLEEIVANAVTFQDPSGGSSRLAAADVEIDDRDVLAQVADQLKNKIGRGVVVLLGRGADSHPLIVSVSKELNPHIKAGEILKTLASRMGGKGGGRPDFAQGAVSQREGWSEALGELRGTFGK